MGKHQVSFVMIGEISEKVRFSHVGTNLKYFLSGHQPGCISLGLLLAPRNELLSVRVIEAKHCSHHSKVT